MPVNHFVRSSNPKTIASVGSMANIDPSYRLAIDGNAVRDYRAQFRCYR